MPSTDRVGPTAVALPTDADAIGDHHGETAFLPTIRYAVWSWYGPKQTTEKKRVLQLLRCPWWITGSTQCPSPMAVDDDSYPGKDRVGAGRSEVWKGIKVMRRARACGCSPGSDNSNGGKKKKRPQGGPAGLALLTLLTAHCRRKALCTLQGRGGDDTRL